MYMWRFSLSGFVFSKMQNTSIILTHKCYFVSVVIQGNNVLSFSFVYFRWFYYEYLNFCYKFIKCTMSIVVVYYQYRRPFVYCYSIRGLQSFMPVTLELETVVFELCFVCSVRIINSASGRDVKLCRIVCCCLQFALCIASLAKVILSIELLRMHYQFVQDDAE